MDKLTIYKHHVLGNDFLILLDPEDENKIDADFVRAVCNRHTGIGADSFIRVTLGGPKTDLVMHYFNGDGSFAEMTGNGISCMTHAALLEGVVAGPDVSVSTFAGVRQVHIELDSNGRSAIARTGMGMAEVDEAAAGWAKDQARNVAVSNVGNPHLVLVGPDAGIDLVSFAETAQQHYPEGINVEFVEVKNDDYLTMSVWERGVGLTDACGTGVCAVVGAVRALGLSDSAQFKVEQPGGVVEVRYHDEIELIAPVKRVAVIAIDPSDFE